jgi:hypothetical protein
MQVKRADANGWVGVWHRVAGSEPSSEGASDQGVDPLPRPSTAPAASVLDAGKPLTLTLAVSEPIPPRHPDNVKAQRDATAAHFLRAAELAIGLSVGSTSRPGPFVAAALEAAKWSDEHNQHCRAGTPIDESVQTARRELGGVMAALLAAGDGDVPSRAELEAAHHRLARLMADANKDMPAGLRGLIYGEVSRWLAPHEVQALAAASRVPHMPLEELDRIQRVSAKTSLESLKDALRAAYEAHCCANDDADLAAHYGECLKHTCCAMELVFHDAMNEWHAAERASKTMQSDLSPGSWERRVQFARRRAQKKKALLNVAEDLQTVTGLRMTRLEAFCESVQPRDGLPSPRFDEARAQLALVKSLMAVCVYTRSM